MEATNHLGADSTQRSGLESLRCNPVSEIQAEARALSAPEDLRETQVSKLTEQSNPAAKCTGQHTMVQLRYRGEKG